REHIANRIAQTAAVAVGRVLGDDQANPELASWAEAAQAMAETAVEAVLVGHPPVPAADPRLSGYSGMQPYRAMDEAEYQRSLADLPDPDSPAGLLRGLVEIVAGPAESPYPARFSADTPT